jgi:hypothetical protein
MSDDDTHRSFFDGGSSEHNYLNALFLLNLACFANCHCNAYHMWIEFFVCGSVDGGSALVHACVAVFVCFLNGKAHCFEQKLMRGMCRL